jgi:hypothetical protein
MLLDFRPVGGWQNKDGQLSASEVLLVTEVLVSCQEQVKLRLSRSQQITIGQGRPPQFIGGRNSVSGKVSPQRDRSSLIKEDSHLPGGSSSDQALLSVMKHRFYLIEANARKPSEKVLNAGPALKVFKESPDWNAGAPKDPRTAHLVCVTLDCRTLAPINHLQ